MALLEKVRPTPGTIAEAEAEAEAETAVADTEEITASEPSVGVAAAEGTAAADSGA